MNKKIKSNLPHMGLIKTIRFNRHYFGFKSIFKPRAVVARNVKLGKLKGSISAPAKVGSMMIGFAIDKAYPIKKVKTYFFNEGKLDIVEHFSLGKGSSFYNGPEAESRIVDTSIGQGTMIKLYKGIEMGSNVAISWDCQIIDDDSHSLVDMKTNEILNTPEKIKFGNNVWICSKSIVLKGAEIGDDSVLAAGSFISKKIKDSNVVISNNKVIKTGIIWGDED